MQYNLTQSNAETKEKNKREKKKQREKEEEEDEAKKKTFTKLISSPLNAMNKSTVDSAKSMHMNDDMCRTNGMANIDVVSCSHVFCILYANAANSVEYIERKYSCSFVATDGGSVYHIDNFPGANLLINMTPAAVPRIDGLCSRKSFLFRSNHKHKALMEK